MNKSESIKELSAALVEFHKKETVIKKDATNPFYHNKYASLSGIIKAVKSNLAECGLSVIQFPAEGNKLETILLHSSGEYISETYDMKPTRPDPQQQGSAITYQRRYALGAILNLDIDEDDDGTEASKPNEKKAEPKPKATRPITDDEFSRFSSKLRESKSKLEAGNLLAETRKKVTFDNAQENIITEITDNI